MFTKEYLTELLKQRIGELQAEEQSGPEETRERKLLRRYRSDNLIAAAREVVKRRPLLNKLEDDLANLELDPANEALVREVQYRLNDVTRSPDARSAHDYRVTSELEEIVRRQQMKNLGNTRDEELTRLRRVLDYVTKAPADQFSMTLMTKLGFMDVIKQAINR